MSIMSSKLKCYTSNLCNNYNIDCTVARPNKTSFLKGWPWALFMDTFQNVWNFYSCICDSWKRSLEIIRVNSLIRSDCLCPFDVDFPGLACCRLLVCFCGGANSDFLTGLCCCGCCCCRGGCCCRWGCWCGAWVWWTEEGLVIILGGDVCCWGTWTCCCCCCCCGTFCCCWPELNYGDLLPH